TEGRRRTAPQETQVTENEFGRFRGVRQRVPVKDRVNVEVFQALDTTVLEAMSSEEPERATEEILGYQRRTALATNDLDVREPVLATHEGDALVVKSAGPDGTLLEVRVSPS